MLKNSGCVSTNISITTDGFEIYSQKSSLMRNQLGTLPVSALEEVSSALMEKALLISSALGARYKVVITIG